MVNFDSFGQDTWEGQFDVRQGEQDAGQVQQDTSQVKQDWRQVQQPGQYGNMRNNLPVSVHHMDQGH